MDPKLFMKSSSTVTLSTTSANLQELWAELFLSLRETRSKKDEDKESLTLKAQEFLEACLKTYEHWMAINNFTTLQRFTPNLFDDPVQVLLSLITLLHENLDGEVEFIANDLRVMELFLQNEIYHEIFIQAPMAVDAILFIIANIKDISVKALAVRVINRVCSSDQIKLAFGIYILHLLTYGVQVERHVFRIMIPLLFDDDLVLNTEIVNALTNFVTLSTDFDGIEQSNPASLLSAVSVVDVTDPGSSDQPSTVGFRMLSALTGFWPRVFKENNLITADEKKSEYSSLPEGSFIPSKNELDDFEQFLLNNNQGEGVVKFKKLREKQENRKFSHLINRYAVDYHAASEKSSVCSENNQNFYIDRIPELKRKQYAYADRLTRLLEKDNIFPLLVKVLLSLQSNELIKSFTDKMRVEIVEITCRLLLENEENQNCFKNSDGYAMVFNLMNDIFSRHHSKQISLEFFDLLFESALDFDGTRMVNNADALKLVVEFATSSGDIEARIAAVGCLQDILISNSLNTLLFDSFHIFKQFLSLLDKACAQSGPFNLFHVLGLSPEETEDSADLVFLYLEEIINFLNYAAVIFCKRSTFILNEFVKILLTVHNDSFCLVKVFLLRGCQRLLNDFLARQVEVDQYLKLFLQLLRQHYQIPEVEDLDDLDDMEDFAQASPTTIDQAENKAYQTWQYEYEEHLLILQIIGLLVCSGTTDPETFEFLQGYQSLFYAIILSTSHCWQYGQEGQMIYNEVAEKNLAEASIWIGNSVLIKDGNCSREGMKWQVHMLKAVLNSIESRKNQLPSSATPKRYSFPWFHCLICESFAYIFKRSDKSKQRFVQQGGIEVLLGVFSSTPHTEVATAALLAVSEFFTGYKHTAKLLGEKFGYLGFLELVLASCRPLDKLACEIILEVATIGNVAEGFHESLMQDFSTKEINNFLYIIQHPRLLFLDRIPLSRQIRSCNWMTEELPISAPVDSSNDRLMHEISSWATSPPPLPPLPATPLLNPPQQVTKQRRKPSTAYSVGEGYSSAGDESCYSFSSTDTHAPFEKGTYAGYVQELPLTSLSQSLSQVTFQDEEASMMPLRLLVTLIEKGNDLKNYLFDLVIMLLKANPSNQKLMYAGGAIDFFIRRMIKDCLSPEPSSMIQMLSHLLGWIASYTIEPNEVSLLLNLIYDPYPLLPNYEPSMTDIYDTDDEPFYNMKLVELQTQLMYCLEHVSCRMEPKAFFNFDGLDSYLTHSFARLPIGGLSVAFWVKITAFASDFIEIFSLSPSSAAGIRYFLKKQDGGKWFLTLSTTTKDNTTTEIVYDQFDLSLGGWNHLCISLSPQEHCLLVNGYLVQAIKSSMYESLPKRGEIKFFFGGGGGGGQMIEAIGIWGQCGSITIYDGQLSQAQSRRIFLGGPDMNLQVLEKDLGVRMLACINPLYLQSQKVEPNCKIHSCKPFKNSAAEAGGESVFFPMLEMSLEQQLVGLRILANLLKNTETRYLNFVNDDGPWVVMNLLQLSEDDITVDHVNILFELISNGYYSKGHLMIIRCEWVQVLLELLYDSHESVQYYAIRRLAEAVIDNEDNVKLWRQHVPLEALLDILESFTSTLRPFILRLIDCLLRKSLQDELSIIFNFVAFEIENRLELKADLLELVLMRAYQDLMLLEKVKIMGTLQFLISLLEFPKERIRLIALKLIGLCLSSNPKKSRSTMLSIGGYESLKLYLATFRVTRDVVQTLLGIAVDAYVCTPPPSPLVSTSLSSATSTLNGADTKSQVLAHPEIIKVLFELFKDVRDSADLALSMSGIQELLTDENVEILWKHNWAHWIATFYRDKQIMRIPHAHTFKAILDDITVNMMLYDVKKRPSAFSQLKGSLTTYSDFETHLFEKLLLYFFKSPKLEADGSAYNILYNLTLIYKHLEEFLPVAPVCYQLFALVINEMSFQNDYVVNQYMRKYDLFSIRDTCILRLLQMELSTADYVQFFTHFSFQTIMDQPKFKNGGGVLLLLRAFHKAEKSVKSQIVKALYTTVMNNPVNWRSFTKIVGDLEVIEKFSSVTDIPTTTSGGLSVQEFIQWYYGNDTISLLRRDKVLHQIESLYFPYSLHACKNDERVVVRRNRWSKQFADRLLKQATTSNKLLTILKEKTTELLSQRSLEYQQKLEYLKRIRMDHIKKGEQKWHTQTKSTSTLL